jgi:hypothetical protein
VAAVPSGLSPTPIIIIINNNNISLLDSSATLDKGLYLVSSIQKARVLLNIKACY